MMELACRLELGDILGIDGLEQRGQLPKGQQGLRKTKAKHIKLFQRLLLSSYFYYFSLLQRILNA